MPTLDDAFDWFREHWPFAGVSESEEPTFRGLCEALLGRSLGPAALRATLSALEDRGLIEAEELDDADLAELAGIKGVSSPRILKPLQTLAHWVASQGGVEALRDCPTPALREELFRLRGIGEAGVDSILLEGLNRPVFPVDRPVYRILVRHGWVDVDAGYEEASDALRRFAPDDPGALRELRSQLEAIGARYCKVAAPRCEHCPLRPLLPEGGPLTPELE